MLRSLCPVCLLEPRDLPTFGPLGPEFLVNTFTTFNQVNPTVGRDAVGNFVIAWQSQNEDGSGYGVYARRYNAAGEPQGGAFRINQVTTGSQQSPKIAMQSNGDFVVAWQGVDGSGTGIWARRYNADATPKGGEFLVNFATAGAQTLPAIGGDAAGRFLIAWTSDTTPDSTVDVLARRYDEFGNPAGGEFTVSQAPDTNQSSPAVAMDADGDAVVVFTSAYQDLGTNNIYARRFPLAGGGGNEFRVNVNTVGIQNQPAVAMDPGGDFLVTWSSPDGSSNGIFARRFSAAGTAQTTEFRVNATTANNQLLSSVALDAAGTAMVAWTSLSQDGGDAGVFARRFGSNGTAISDEFLVNQTTTNSQTSSAVAVDAAGNAVFAWQSFAQDTPTTWGIFARRFGTELLKVQQIVIDDGTAQRSRVATATVTFSAAATLPGNPADAFVLSRTGPGNTGPVGLSASIITADPTSVRLTFTGGFVSGGSLIDGNYELKVLAAKVTNGNGQTLAADVTTHFFRLYGDADGNRQVNFTDFLAFRTAFGQSGSAAAIWDTNGDGTVDFADFLQFRSRFGTSLAP